MMRHTIRFVAFAAALSALLFTTSAVAQSKGAALFNGKNLAGWSHFLVCSYYLLAAGGIPGHSPITRRLFLLARFRSFIHRRL